MTQLQTATTTAVTRVWPASKSAASTVDILGPVLERVGKRIAPVWPLSDYVAVNPYQGLADLSFSEAHEYLRTVSEFETLMPIAYYRERFSQGAFGHGDLEAALDEWEAEGQASFWTVDEVLDRLSFDGADDGGDADASTAEESQRRSRLRPLSEYARTSTGVDWSETIRDEISKHLSAHYDEGQAIWASPFKGMSLYQAWREAAKHDRNVEVLGMKGFRGYVAQLPETPQASVAHSLKWLGVPEPLWESFLLAEALSVPGWSAFAKYKDSVQEADGDDHFNSLLAIRLAYDAALSDVVTNDIRWDAFLDSSNGVSETDLPSAESQLQMILLRASEIAVRRQLLASIRPTQPVDSTRKAAQMVFCIDVRSERIRRQLESISSEIETFGFAGFFGMPIESVPLGSERGVSHVPVLLKPQFRLHEGIRDEDRSGETVATERRRWVRTWRELWKGFQVSAVSCFSFVESTGLLYAAKLMKQTVCGGSGVADPRCDGVDRNDAERLGPTLRGLNHQGITTSRQVELAETMLRNLGLTSDFARLVVFCGHASQTSNNPLAASLDCGACGGHSGEPNARFAAMLLNQPYIRAALAERGIEIPDDTHFLAGLHNTTTDQIRYFDLDEVPPSHRRDLEQLIDHSLTAGKRTCRERMPTLASDSLSDLMRRAVDWSEVRPEWGLAGNAAFIVAPRGWTSHANLNGQAFLHSYEHSRDPEGAVLELIMTAPMVVAHWINMQYYASTVDPSHFGSGDKTLHNVVGRFGVLSGNGGDLTTGMSWQSLHTGQEYRHTPLRLQSVIAAPRSAIDRVIEAHPMVADLLNHGWMHLVAIEEGNFYRYTSSGEWTPLDRGDASDREARLDQQLASSPIEPVE